MEEYIGGLWDKLIRHTAYRGHPKARVNLKENRPNLNALGRWQRPTKRAFQSP